MIKKWLPFSLIMFVVVASTSYLFLAEDSSDYQPKTDNPEIIYREACMHCHGDKGQGTGLLYPSFESELSKSEITSAIKEGFFLMPSFSKITSDTLQSLVDFIYLQSYKKN